MNSLSTFHIENLQNSIETQILNDRIQIMKSPVSGVEYYDNQGLFTEILRGNYPDISPNQVIILFDPEELTKIDEIEFLPNYYLDNQKILFEKLQKELKGKKINFENAHLIIENFNLLNRYVAELPFEKCSIELTKSNSIKISLSFANNILLIISKPLELIKEVSKNDIIFSVFNKRELIATNVENISDFFYGFKKFLNL